MPAALSLAPEGLAEVTSRAAPIDGERAAPARAHAGVAVARDGEPTLASIRARYAREAPLRRALSFPPALFLPRQRDRGTLAALPHLQLPATKREPCDLSAMLL